MRIKTLPLLLFLAANLCCVIAFGQPDTVRFPAPGATGMNTRSDIQELRQTDARLLKNTVTSVLIGALPRRNGFTGSSTAIDVWLGSATAHYDHSNRYYNLIGTGSRNISNLYVGITASNDTTRKFWTPATDESYLRVRFSDIKTLKPDNNINLGKSVVSGAARLRSEGGRVYCIDPGGVVLMYEPETPYYASNPSADEYFDMDTSAYEPTVWSLGIEAPGQPRVGLLSESGGLYGVYQYTYTVGGHMAIPSVWMRVDSQKVFLTLFEASPRDTLADTITANVFRRTPQNPKWVQVGTLYWLLGQNEIFYIDSGQVSVATPTTLSYGINSPGTLRRTNGDSLVYTTAMDTTANMASMYDSAKVAYSYYDPVTGLESPMGPPADLDKIMDSSGGVGAWFVKYVKGWTNVFQRPKWIRVYRTRTDDTLTFYAWFQVRANGTYPLDTTIHRYAVYPGYGSDADLADGMTDFAQWDYLVSPWMPYGGDHVFTDADGGALTRPPNVSQLDIAFSDLAYSNGRLWGIGDPLYPTRLYFSGAEAFSQTDLGLARWSSVNYLELDDVPGSRQVALEALPTGQQTVLWAIGTKSVHAVTGYDAEYDLSVDLISESMGTISRELTIQADGAIYFVDNRLRVSRIKSGLEDISSPVENYMDSLFATVDIARRHGQTARWGDAILFVNDSTGVGLRYDLRDQSWSLISVPFTGDFSWVCYDSTGGAGNKYYLLPRDSALPVLWPNDGYQDSLPTSTVDPEMVYRSWFYGNDVDLFWMQEVHLQYTADSGVSVTVSAVTPTGDTLASSSFTTGATDNSKTVGMAFSEALRCGIQVTATGSGKFILHSARAHVNKIGGDIARD